MKGIAKIALSVALIVIVVLSIVVASVAWFTSNPEVTASDVTLNAARTLTVSFDTTVSGTDYKYNGQIGNVASGEDAPYVYEAGGFNVTVNSLSSELSRARIKVEFGTVTIHTNVYGMGTVSDVLITDLFHVTANVYKPVESGNENTLFVKDATHGNFRAYNSATDSALQKYQKAISSLTIADDGVLMDGNSVALFAEGTYALSFTYVFLPDAAYAVWEDACNGEANFTDIYGYELAGDGEYVAVESYTAYKPKYHYGLQRYDRSGTEGNYTYTANSESGGYVRVITSYIPYVEGVTTGQRYHRVNGFPYSDDKYMGETFTFTVACTLEEV